VGFLTCTGFLFSMNLVDGGAVWMMDCKEIDELCLQSLIHRHL
jgi:hypothetical protein